MSLGRTQHGGTKRTGTDRPLAGALVLIALIATACGPSAGTTGSGSASSCTARVTPDCGGYMYDNPSPGTVVVKAPKTSGSNNREFFWAQRERDQVNSTVCATFATGQGIDQQGVVLRQQFSSTGSTTAITVTRNIWMHIFDVFNFHIWNTALPLTHRFAQFGSIVVRDLPVRPAVYPLRLCARTVRSTDVVQFVAWRKGQARPPWGSKTHGGEAFLPAGAPTSGQCGWYAGHLVPGTTMTFSDLTIDGKMPTGLP